MSKKPEFRYLTEIEKEAIEKMFFGPFEPQWKDSMGRVDNRDQTIADRLSLPFSAVSLYITKAYNYRKKLKLPINVIEDPEDEEFIMVTFESRMNSEI